ncbi:hypothetical protein D3C71_1834680 [compost metagenome]
MMHAAYPLILRMHRIANMRKRTAQLAAELDNVHGRHAIKTAPGGLRLDDSIIIAAIGDIDE